MPKTKITTHVERDLFEQVKQDFEDRYNVEIMNKQFVELLLEKQLLDVEYNSKLLDLIARNKMKRNLYRKRSSEKG